MSTLKKADKDYPKPAELVVHSQSGSVSVKVSGLDIPKREYRTNVISKGGSIHGSYIHGKQTIIESSSGSIGVDILPYSANDYESTLFTKSNSGSQKITVLSPYFNPGTSIARLKSTHIGSSGQLQLKYPQEWEGRISGQTSSGSLTLKGRNVEIIKFGSRGGGKYVIAKKGEGDSALQFDIHSGSVDATIGF